VFVELYGMLVPKWDRVKSEMEEEGRQRIGAGKEDRQDVSQAVERAGERARCGVYGGWKEPSRGVEVWSLNLGTTGIDGCEEQCQP